MPGITGRYVGYSYRFYVNGKYTEYVSEEEALEIEKENEND